MIPNIAQSIEDLLKSATPETKLLWQQIRLLTGENSAVQQYHYIGAIIGSEFMTYDANRFYLALNLKFTYSRADSAITLGGNIQLHDQNNALSFSCSNNSSLWDTTAAQIKYVPITSALNNIPFSCIGARYGYDEMQFIGFKFTR